MMHAHLKDGVHVVRGDILLEDGDQKVRDSLHGSLKQLVALFRVLQMFLQLMIFTHSISSDFIIPRHVQATQCFTHNCFLVLPTVARRTAPCQEEGEHRVGRYLDHVKLISWCQFRLQLATDESRFIAQNISSSWITH